jgi:RsiW-degrading membrane proteinase PrsW (M82 family)
MTVHTCLRLLTRVFLPVDFIIPSNSSRYSTLLLIILTFAVIYGGLAIFFLRRKDGPFGKPVPKRR